MNAADDKRLWSEALDLLLQLRENPADRALRGKVARWQEQSAAHRQTWSDVEQVWRVSDARVLEMPVSPEAESIRPRMTRRRVVAGLGLAAAAGVMAVAVPEVLQRARADV